MPHNNCGNGSEQGSRGNRLIDDQESGRDAESREREVQGDARGAENPAQEHPDSEPLRGSEEQVREGKWMGQRPQPRHQKVAIDVREKRIEVRRQRERDEQGGARVAGEPRELLYAPSSQECHERTAGAANGIQ